MAMQPEKIASERKKLILVVDDDLSLLKAVHHALEEAGYAVLSASNGKIALDLLKQATPDLFILDLKMEPINGFDLYQQIRKIFKFSHTPVFFFTGMDHALGEKFSKSLGVDSFIQKPVEIEVLEDKIKKVLSL